MTTIAILITRTRVLHADVQDLAAHQHSKQCSDLHNCVAVIIYPTTSASLHRDTSNKHIGATTE